MVGPRGKDKKGEQLDIFNFGTESGRLFFITINHGTLPVHNSRPIEITKDKDCKHAAAVSTMLFMSTPAYCNNLNLGILLSGSLDRSIKVCTNYIRSLFGPSETVTKLVDGNDGVIEL